MSAAKDKTHAPASYRSKLAEIADRIKAEMSTEEGRKLELYGEIGRRLGEIDGGRSWGRSRVYAILAGQQRPGKRLAAAIDHLHQDGQVLKPAPVCRVCGEVHVTKRCTRKQTAAPKRVRLVAQVPEDWRQAVREAALAEGETVAEWLRRTVAEALMFEE